MRRPNPFAGIILLISLLAIAGYITSIRIPIIAQNRIEGALSAAGFNAASLPLAKSGISTIVYENIELDAEGFSTLKSLTVEYNPLSIFIQNQIKALKIEGLRLTGEISNNRQLTLAGWQPDTGQKNSSLISHLFNVENTTLSDIQISILSANHGGISIQLEGEGVKGDDGIYFNGKLKNTQKEMRYSANINGKISNAQSWQSQIEIENIRLNTPDIKATRASGTVMVQKDVTTPATISGEIRAGNMTLANFPWTSSAITLTGNPTRPGVIIAAKAAGHEDVEVGLSLSDMRNTNELSGYIYSTTLGQLLSYLAAHEALPFDIGVFRDVTDIQDIEIAFEKNNDLIEITSAKTATNETFSGLLQFKNIDGAQKLLNAAIESTNTGKLRITNPDFFKLLKMPQTEKNNIRKALSNLLYDQILIEMTTAEQGGYMFQIKMRGNNPDLEEGRSFKLDFAFTTTLEELLEILLKKEE
jgi:hypothetical protein